MSVKINVSYTPDDEAAAERIAAYLKGILPRHKVTKSTDRPPYNHIYFIPTKAKKTTKYGENA